MNNNLLNIASGVFLGLLFFLIFLWIIAAIVWLVYGKRYFAPENETRENTFNPYLSKN